MSVVEGWKTESLGRIAQLTMGQSPDSKYYSAEDKEGMPFLQGCAEFESKFPTPALFCSHAKKTAKRGSILFSVRAPVGKTNIADRDYIIGRGLAAISGIEVDQTYLEHYLAYVEPRFRSASQGSTFEAINSSELSDWPIEHPTSKPEQTKIAEILSTVDRAIEQTEALIAKQQRIKTGLMQDLLTRGIDEHGNLRSEQTHEFKDSPRGRIPVEWGRRSIRSLGAGHPGIVQTGPFGAQLHAEDYVEDGVPLLLIRNLQDGRIDMDGMPRVREADATRLSRYALQPGDVVFSRVGRVGSCFLVETEHDGWLISGQLLRVRMAKDVVDNRYLYRALASKYAQDHIAGASVGTTRTSINTQILESLEILVPTDRREQAKIAEVLLTADQALKQMEALLAKQQRIKTGLMQDLLTGKKRVTALLHDTEVAIL